MPGAVLGVGDAAVNKLDKKSFLLKVILFREADDKP